MTGPPRRVVLRPLRSRSLWAATLFVLLALPAISVWVWVTDPSNRPFTLLLLPALYVGLVAVTMQVELTGAGGDEPAALTWSSPLAWWRRRVPLRSGTAVQLRGAGSSVHLVARAQARRRSVAVVVLALTEYVQRSRDADELDALAAALAGSGATGAKGVAEELRAQAAYVRSGAEVVRSPLAARLGRTLFGLRY